VRLEKPLHREVAAAVRQLYQRCRALRYALSQAAHLVVHSSSSSSGGGDGGGQVPVPVQVQVQVGAAGEGARESMDGAAAAVAAEGEFNSSCSSNTSSSNSSSYNLGVYSAPMTPAQFQDGLAALNMLATICGSYFGQGEEYDAFNRALMLEAAAAEEDGEDAEEWDDENEEEDGEQEEEDGGMLVEGEEEDGEDEAAAEFGDVVHAEYVHYDYSSSAAAAPDADAGVDNAPPAGRFLHRVSGPHAAQARAGGEELEDGEEVEAEVEVEDGTSLHLSKKLKG
jgi:hypothetical protein